MEFRPTARTHQPARGHQPAAAPQAPAQAAPVAAAPIKHRRRNRIGIWLRYRWWLILVILLLAGIGFLTYGYIHTKNQLNAAKNPASAGKTELQQIVAQVSKSIDLPTGETPTLATVNDASKLKNQTFFRNAQNGDKVLIYTKAGRALLYRPSTQKVIEYAPVNLGNQ